MISNNGLYEKPRLIKDSKKDSYNTVQYVNVFVSKDVIAEFFINSGRAFAVTRGLPKDAVLVRFGFDQGLGHFVATFEHPSFDQIVIGHELPVFHVEYTAFEMVETGEGETKQ